MTLTCVVLADRPELVGATASLLAAQWPATSATSRRSSLSNHVRKAKPNEVPCHLLLLAEDESVVAHCRLQPACENADGFSAAVTSVVVDPARRGTGLGRTLLGHAEAATAKFGYGYLYLWTEDAQKFYEACGYDRCEKVSLHRPALATLGSAAIGKLEALFAQKAATAGASAADDGAGAESSVRADSTWFRKRLLELHPASKPLTPEAFLASAHDALRHAGEAPNDDDASSTAGDADTTSGWSVAMPTPFTWERQIGPCCGLAALRMARSALHPGCAAATTTLPPRSAESWAKRMGGNVELRVDANADVAADASVLTAAIERGFSSDGEVFDIHDLATLAADVCGMVAEVIDLGSVAAAASSATRVATSCEVSTGVVNVADADADAATQAVAEEEERRRHEAFGAALGEWLAQGGLAVMPYDKGGADHLPVLNGGAEAHYLLVVGVATRGRSDGGTSVAMTPAASDGTHMLVCTHGLSKRPLVVSPDALLASNAQLMSMKKGVNSKRWVVKAGGLRLAHRLLLLSPPPYVPPLPIELVHDIVARAVGQHTRLVAKTFRDTYDATLTALAVHAVADPRNSTLRRHGPDAAGGTATATAVLCARVAACPALTALDVSGLAALDDTTLARVLNICPALKVLNVSNNRRLTERSLQLLHEASSREASGGGGLRFVASGTFWSPSPLLTPLQVVVNQVLGLRMDSDEGIALTFGFASPANARTTGPVDRFGRMIREHFVQMLISESALVRQIPKHAVGLRVPSIDESVDTDDPNRDDTVSFCVLFRSHEGRHRNGQQEYGRTAPAHSRLISRFQWTLQREPAGVAQYARCWMTAAVAPVDVTIDHDDAFVREAVKSGFLRV